MGTLRIQHEHVIAKHLLLTIEHRPGKGYVVMVAFHPPPNWELFVSASLDMNDAIIKKYNIPLGEREVTRIEHT